MIDVKVEKSEQKDLEEAAKILSAKQFGEAVLKRLKELKWRQQDLADAIFTGQPVISEITRGVYENLTLDWVSRLAKALKMPPSELARAYFLEEDRDAKEQEEVILEKIRSLLTEYYNIGGKPPTETETPPQPPKSIRDNLAKSYTDIGEQAQRERAKEAKKRKVKLDNSGDEEKGKEEKPEP
jgi:transcriptional regulator with XRE-family HTH domain